MILAQLSVYPLGSGSSVSRYVRKSIEIIQQSGLRYQIGPMATSLEVEQLQDLFDLVSRLRDAQLAEGAERIIIDLKVDDRRDKAATLQSKIEAVTS